MYIRAESKLFADGKELSLAFNLWRKHMEQLIEHLVPNKSWVIETNAAEGKGVSFDAFIILNALGIKF